MSNIDKDNLVYIKWAQIFFKIYMSKDMDIVCYLPKIISQVKISSSFYIRTKSI